MPDIYNLSGDTIGALSRMGSLSGRYPSNKTVNDIIEAELNAAYSRMLQRQALAQQQEQFEQEQKNLMETAAANRQAGLIGTGINAATMYGALKGFPSLGGVYNWGKNLLGVGGGAESSTVVPQMYYGALSGQPQTSMFPFGAATGATPTTGMQALPTGATVGVTPTTLTGDLGGGIATSALPTFGSTLPSTLPTFGASTAYSSYAPFLESAGGISGLTSPISPVITAGETTLSPTVASTAGVGTGGAGEAGIMSALQPYALPVAAAAVGRGLGSLGVAQDWPGQDIWGALKTPVTGIPALGFNYLGDITGINELGNIGREMQRVEEQVWGGIEDVVSGAADFVGDVASDVGHFFSSLF